LAEHSGDAVFGVYPRHERLNYEGIARATQQVIEHTGLVSWELYFTKQAQKDAKKVSSSNLRPQVERLLDILKLNPFQNPPPYERLVGDLDGAYSRRINIHNRLVYQVLKGRKAIKIIRLWTHYE